MLRELTIEERGLVAGGDDMGGGFGDAFGDNGGSYSQDPGGFGPAIGTDNGDGTTTYTCGPGQIAIAVLNADGVGVFCGPDRGPGQ